MRHTLTYQSTSVLGGSLGAYYLIQPDGSVIEKIFLGSLMTLESLEAMEDTFGTGLTESDRYAKNTLDQCEVEQFISIIDDLMQSSLKTPKEPSIYALDGAQYSFKIEKGDEIWSFSWQIESDQNPELWRIVEFIEDRISPYWKNSYQGPRLF